MYNSLFIQVDHFRTCFSRKGNNRSYSKETRLRKYIVAKILSYNKFFNTNSSDSIWDSALCTIKVFWMVQEVVGLWDVLLVEEPIGTCTTDRMSLINGWTMRYSHHCVKLHRMAGSGVRGQWVRCLNKSEKYHAPESLRPNAPMYNIFTTTFL